MYGPQRLIEALDNFFLKVPILCRTPASGCANFMQFDAQHSKMETLLLWANATEIVPLRSVHKLETSGGKLIGQAPAPAAVSRLVRCMAMNGNA